MAVERPRPALYAVIAGTVVLAVAAFWLPRWWENREYRSAEAIAGVGSRILSGTLADARRRIDPGLAAARVTAALGQPSFSVRTEGTSVHEIWTYYYADGTLTVNLTDGNVARVSTAFGPPRIRTSKRPGR
jgi:flagellar basal body-associated protein FliL